MSKMTMKTEGDKQVIVNTALCRTTRSRIPRPYRSAADPEMAARS